MKLLLDRFRAETILHQLNLACTVVCVIYGSRRVANLLVVDIDPRPGGVRTNS